MEGPVKSNDLASVLDSNGRLLDLYGLKKNVFYRVCRRVNVLDTAPFASLAINVCSDHGRIRSD